VAKIELDNRLRSALIMVSILCLTVAGMYFFIYLLSGIGGTSYRFFINNSEIAVDDMASLEESIIPYFPNQVPVEIYNSNHVLLETLNIAPYDLQPRVQTDFVSNLNRNDTYSRLRMYAEPNMLDLFIRKIYVDKSTFFQFVSDMALLDIQALKVSAKAVFFR